MVYDAAAISISGDGRIHISKKGILDCVSCGRQIRIGFSNYALFFNPVEGTYSPAHEMCVINDVGKAVRKRLLDFLASPSSTDLGSNLGSPFSSFFSTKDKEDQKSN